MMHFPMFILSLSAAAISGCSEAPIEVSNSAGAAEIVNSVCPIMGNAVEAKDLDASLIKDWNGKKVGFCCPPCLEEWDELSDSEKADKIANPAKDHDSSSHEHTSESAE